MKKFIIGSKLWFCLKMAVNYYIDTHLVTRESTSDSCNFIILQR
jgi:hypothetical protein